MTSKAEFDARVEAFGSLLEEHYRPPVCEDLLERYFRADEELELIYRELDAFAKSCGIDLNRRLAEEGFLELMWYKQPVPRPSTDVLEAWEARVGRVSLAELRLQNKNAKIVELNARFNHAMKHEKLAAIYMLEPGDSVEIGPEDGLIYFCDRDIGYFKTDVPNLREFIEDPRAMGLRARYSRKSRPCKGTANSAGPASPCTSTTRLTNLRAGSETAFSFPRTERVSLGALTMWLIW